MIVQLSKKGDDRLSIKDAKLKFIIDVATKLFLERGITSVTIKDIAQEVGLGEATIYRYFLKKQNIVIAVAMKLEEEVFKDYFDLSDSETGFDKLKSFYNKFLDIFHNRMEFYKFISEFDSYVINEKSDLEDYEKALLPFYKSFEEAYLLGLKDNTVRKLNDLEKFYLTTTHSLMGLSKKLALDGMILSQDKKYESEEELKCLIEIILTNLKPL